MQEVEPIDSVVLFDGECQPTYRDRVGDPAYPSRAIGMFSYTETKVERVDAADPLYGFRRYEARRGDMVFNVVGIWTAATKSRETSYMQAHEGLRHNADWIRQRPTVILGDFNDNASWKLGNWGKRLDLLQPFGLVSAYHHYFADEPFGAETRPTYFHNGKESTMAHLDY